ncbi:threonine--tRNA ligase [Legionella pneumophila serogroup 1]|uniref:Threonine--tRNA ligase n=1 Tax=Legionella pneumophila (strain Corby) TaxID=400673 RepID=SYT_LEGPC|nr:threonine--tRNA ligase [Legionella pneumophila]A5IAK9.1 RecName: Full=Threonine--tRNA ligase; AltName: Full=Threonyl-tRNA synthetase; Short=ThrRS [Legionella pneumophila str. Corby]HCC3233534.1 threonine--tRNA ligase [Legionella pneumophila subsp. pneumophila]ABQ54409.1 threonyl tRNA synthase [Legionella pneumophila str. Corby]ADG26112.1 threonyl-tRNA synthetase [Legionella pneumophila 2300/99 Alcoy]MCO1452010.1 threonine--tRNA ligase [Legionella pneumophila]MCW8458711.1 threonine--tRNA li
MPNVKLPDGNVKHFEAPLTIYDVAHHISPGLAKAAIAGRVDGVLVDTSYLIKEDCSLIIVTEKHEDSLEIIRHSTAHLLAQAVKALFPSAQVTIGPVIEDGFYYDFAFERSFTPDDLSLIEAKMHELAKANLSITRRELPRNEAIQYFKSLGEEYKAKIIADIPENEALSLYRQGDFEDLCRGPHVPSTGFLKAFKLTKVAGAYWRGDSNNEMLQRIYGTAWADKKSLEEYLFRLEEAEKRDHRKLGKALDLFHFQDIAPGMVFWHPKGWTIYQELEHYMRNRLVDFGYQEIRTPQLVDRSLWEKSGHWANFRDEMFVTETENRHYAVKPMSCPCHVQIYNHGLKSYRDLPLRLSEFGNCHRCEPSGALHGLMRVRNMVQDDAHIFCTEDQIQSEVAMMLELVQSVYKDFGFTEIKYRLALRPEKRVGSDDVWDKAETALKLAMQGRNIEWVDAPGEGAFYGPKIECSLSDCLGRIWQCGTIQVDFSMPARLEASYVAEDGSKQTPVMLHRAILGSFERFMGILIEHYAGKLPLWLSPVQAVVLTISEKQNEYAEKVRKTLQKRGIRANFDLRNEKIGFKIREHTLQKIPYLLVVGDKEVENCQVAVRTRDGIDLGVMTIDTICDTLTQEIIRKGSI